MGNNANLLAVDFSGLAEKIFPKHVVEKGLFVINDSVVSGFIVVAVILIAALILRLTVIRHWKTTPTGAQMFLEWLAMPTTSWGTTWPMDKIKS